MLEKGSYEVFSYSMKSLGTKHILLPSYIFRTSEQDDLP